MPRLYGSVLASSEASGPDGATADTSVAAPNSAIPPPMAAARHHADPSTRPSTIPAQKNASHGSRGWVPLMKTSVTHSTGLPSGSSHQLTESSSRRCWVRSQCSPAPASAAPTRPPPPSASEA